MKEKETLQQTENKWLTLVHAIPDFVMQIDRDYKIIFVNHVQTGLKKEDFLGKHVWETVNKTEQVELKRRYEQIFETGNPDTWEMTAFVGPDQLCWYRFHATRFLESSGNVSILIISSDISERKKLEEKLTGTKLDLEQNTELLERTGEMAKVGGWELDLVTNQITFSKETARIHEVDYPYIPLKLSQGNEYYPPEVWPIVQSAVIAAIEHGKPYDLESPFITAKGKHIWVRIQGYPVRENDKTIKLRGTFQDITERKQAEEGLKASEARLRLALQASGDGLWDWDIVSNTMYYSPEWEAMFGLEHGTVAQNLETMNSLVHPEDIDGMFNEDRRYLNQEIPTFSKEFRMIRKDGTIMHTWHRATATFNYDGKAIRMIGTTTDISKHKNMEEMLAKSKETAEMATRAKSEFLAIMSHEIRTPLNGVIGFTGLLLRTDLNEIQGNYSKIISKSANSLLFLLNDILDFSKIEAGKLELLIEKIDIIELVKECSEIIKFKTDEKKINLLVCIESNTPRFIYADSTRIRQILLNLLGNAVKFTTRGKIEIKLEVTEINSESHDKKLLFSVTDTGKGISDKNREKIFEAFSQEDSSISRKYGGTGLGLAISNQLLELMNSKLELESELGKGSKFYFTLQVAEKENLKQESEQFINYSKKNNLAGIQKQNNEIKSLQTINTINQISLPKKILVVDDDEINMLLAHTILSKLVPNGTILRASNGIEAIEQFRKDKPDLIIMDIQMPEMNGYEATIEIRKLESELRTPIIALSAGTTEEQIENCFLAGLDDFVGKPILLDKFEKIVKKWLKL